MNKAIVRAIAGALVVIASSANAGVVYTNVGLGAAGTKLTFDEVLLPDGTPLNNQYSAYGVSFNGAFQSPQGPYTSSPGTAIVGNNIGNFPFPGSTTINSPWSILFDVDVREAAFGIITHPSSTLIEALLDGSVVGSAAAATDTDGTDFFQISGLVFDEIRITTTNTQIPPGGVNDPGALLDNLQFSVVPEPTSLALLSLGLLGLIASRRK